MRTLAALLLLAGAFATAGGPDGFDDYAELVRRAVKEDGIDYAVFRDEEAREKLRSFVEAGIIKRMSLKLGPSRFGSHSWSDADWINWHNARVLERVVQGKSPKEASKVLGECEAMYGSDPRIHFALHRAARSSPKLRIYKEETLDEDLTQAVRVYLNDKRHNEFDTARLKAELSELFYWHRAEFVASVKEKSGAPFQLFLATYVHRASVARRLRSSRWTIRYRTFDWTLNESGVVSEYKGKGGSPLLWIYLIPAGLLLLFGLHSFRVLFRRRIAGSLGEP